jgi:hypothetical protein
MISRYEKDYFIDGNRIPSEAELKTIITVDWLADWLERVSKRLIFFSYKGGCGGEYIINTLSRSFYTTVVNDNKHGETNPMNNRSQSIDHLFNDFFISYRHEDDRIETFSDLARELLEYYSTNLMLCLPNIYHFDMSEDHAIVRLHDVPKFMSLFEDSIKISLTPGSLQWDMYCRIASFLKIQMRPLYTREDKISCVIEEFERITNNEIEDWLINLLPAIRNRRNISTKTLVTRLLDSYGKLDDGVMLFSGTITTLLCEQFYDKHKIDYSIDEIDKKNNADNQYLTHNEDASENYDECKDSLSFHVHGFEDNKYTMDDVMNGNILESFNRNSNLDVTKCVFVTAMNDWFNNNIKFYKQIEFTCCQDVWND